MQVIDSIKARCRYGYGSDHSKRLEDWLKILQTEKMDTSKFLDKEEECNPIDNDIILKDVPRSLVDLYSDQELRVIIY